MHLTQIDQHSGIMTTWELGSQTDPDRLREGLEAIGAPKYAPEPRTWKASLKAALSESFPKGEDMIRATKEKATYSLVAEERDDKRNYYTHNFSASVDENGNLSVEGGYAPLDKLREQMAHFRRVLPGASVSEAMVSYIERLDGLRLKPNGGLYYIPEYSVPAWRKFAQVVEASATGGTENHVDEYVMVITEKSVLDVRRSLVREVTAKLEGMRAEVESGDLGEQAMLNRIESIKPIRDYIASYEGILQDTLGELTAALDETKELIMRTAMQQMGSPDPVPA